MKFLVTLFFMLSITVAAAAQTADFLPTLRGDEAVEQLKQSGQYDSLVEAVKQARRASGQSDEPTTDDAVGQSAKLVAPDGAAGNQFGFSVAVAGNVAVIGAPFDQVGSNFQQGAAYIFTRSGTTWTQQAKLTAADGAANDFFGYSVATSGDDVFVGAPLDSVTQGSAYVFGRTGAVWTQRAKLTAGDGAAGDNFGVSVSVSGNTIVVGAVGDDVGPNINQGSAYIFTGSGTNWAQQAQLMDSDGAANDQFGFSVAISGGTAVVGAPFADVGANPDQGSAYAFRVLSGNWGQGAKTTASDGAAGDLFGWSVAISGDTAVVGAPTDNSSPGAAYVFTRAGAAWTQQAQLIASDGAGDDYFGYSVAVDGDTIIASAVRDDSRGSAYVFARFGTAWVQMQRLIAPDGAADDFFGWSVAVSGDKIVVGAHRADINAFAPTVGDDDLEKSNPELVGVNQGAAYFFTNQLLGPTAAGASVSGRVLTPAGRGLPNAFVHLTNQSGVRRTARTNTFGYYRFDDVAVGQTYILAAASKEYIFMPQIVSVSQDIADVNFIGIAPDPAGGRPPSDVGPDITDDDLKRE